MLRNLSGMFNMNLTRLGGTCHLFLEYGQYISAMKDAKLKLNMFV